MASYKHRRNQVDLLNQIQVLITTTSQDLNAMIGSINRKLTISYSNKDSTKKGKHHNDRTLLQMLKARVSRWFSLMIKVI